MPTIRAGTLRAAIAAALVGLNTALGGTATVYVDPAETQDASGEYPRWLVRTEEGESEGGESAKTLTQTHRFTITRFEARGDNPPAEGTLQDRRETIYNAVAGALCGSLRFSIGTEPHLERWNVQTDEPEALTALVAAMLFSVKTREARYGS